MADKYDEQRREKVRALKERREHLEIEDQRESILEAPSEDIAPRRGKLRQFLQRQAEGGRAPRPGGGGLRQMLAERGGAGEGENRPGRGALLRLARARDEDPSAAADDDIPTLERAKEPVGKGGRLGNRRMLRRRIQARGPNTNLLLAELQRSVQQLAEEVERLRADQARKTTVKKRISSAASRKRRGRPKKA